MPSAPDLAAVAEPLPLPPPPRPPRLARGSLAPPVRDALTLDPPAVWRELAPPVSWGPVERVTLPARAERLALSVVAGLAATVAALALALAI